MSHPPLNTALPDADFYDIQGVLVPAERKKLDELREFLAAEVTPKAADWWNEEHFPAELLPTLGALGLSAPVRHGYSHLFHGLVIAEMTRADTSIATFFMVHHDLFVEALYEFGTAEQKERLLPDAMALHTTGAFALTEPDHGSDVAGGMETTAAPVYADDGGAASGGDAGGASRTPVAWILNGRKRWIGNGTFCDHMLVWARDTETGAVRGFIVDTWLPGFSAERISRKTALRTVQNADVTLENVRVAETDRFPSISSFEDTKRMLLGSRIMVGWQAVGQQLAAFDTARAYALERRQFGRPLAKFQLIQQQLVQILGNATASMAMMARLAALQDGGGIDMAQTALAKAFTTARMRESVALGRGILGGNGILSDYRMAKIFADAEAVYTYEGSYEINTLIAGRAITGLNAIS